MYIYFALAYLAQGISSQFGLISQPSQFFMMKKLGFDAANVSFVMALMMLPWVLKPAYGLLSDAVPIFGYRRKSYIIIAHVIAMVGLVFVSLTHAPYLVLAGLLLIALAMAVATALFLGLAAERGQQDGNATKYVSAQSFYYYVGNIFAVMIGGYLCQQVAPPAALSTSALWALIPVLMLTLISALMVREDKSIRSMETAREAWDAIIDAIKNPRLWLVIAFAALWNFTPSFGVPLYFHESNNLFFEQSIIGQLAAWNALGMMLGAVIYRDMIAKLALNLRVLFVVLAWTASIGSYYFLSSPLWGYPIELFRGCCNTFELLCLYELAALCCNTRNAVSVMALLLASRNIANESGTLLGGNLFSYVFHHQYPPLIAVGILAPLLSLALIPRAVRLHASENTGS